jgi:hypothetical protein
VTTGSAPVPTVTVDQPVYPRAGTVRASVQVVDADNRAVTLSTDGTAPDGTAVHIDQRQTYSDIPRITWRWQGTTAVLGTGLSLTLIAPARSAVLEAVVVDAQGHEVVASCPVVVRRLALGVDVDTTQTPAVWRAELDAVIAGTQPDGPTKLFWAPGRGLPSFTKYGVPASMIPHLCFKDYPTQAAWVALLDAVPDIWPEVWLTWDQEGDRSTTPEAFTSGWMKLVGWAAGHPNRARVRLVPDLTWYWEHFKNADQYAAFIPAGADYLGVDIYPGGQSGWTPMADLLPAPVAAAQAAGVPLVVPEFGVVVPAGATALNLTERARWFAAAVIALDNAGVQAAAWWNAPPSAQVGVFRLAAGDPGWDALRAWWTA